MATTKTRQKRSGVGEATGPASAEVIDLEERRARRRSWESAWREQQLRQIIRQVFAEDRVVQLR